VQPAIGTARDAAFGPQNVLHIATSRWTRQTSDELTVVKLDDWARTIWVRTFAGGSYGYWIGVDFRGDVVGAGSESPLATHFLKLYSRVTLAPTRSSHRPREQDLHNRRCRAPLRAHAHQSGDRAAAPDQSCPAERPLQRDLTELGNRAARPDSPVRGPSDWTHLRSRLKSPTPPADSMANRIIRIMRTSTVRPATRSYSQMQARRKLNRSAPRDGARSLGSRALTRPAYLSEECS
jgi:hypothetical protein